MGACHELVDQHTLHGGFFRCTSSSCGGSPPDSGFETMAASTVTDGRGYLRFANCKLYWSTQPTSSPRYSRSADAHHLSKCPPTHMC